jgi:phenylpropionate dioxygenase-like ring-hydroxylating dioxygenase large terminal subunit
VVQEAGGLLWVWPEVSKAAWANSAATAPLMCNAAKEGCFVEKLPKSWFMRDLPYGIDVLVENLVDPSHLPFSHHKLFPALNRCAPVH